jgi:tRNA modification GTPase
MSYKSKTIAAIATPNTSGSVAMIRISGDDALAIAARVFKPANGRSVREMQGYSAAYGEIRDSGEAVKEASSACPAEGKGQSPVCTEFVKEASSARPAEGKGQSPVCPEFIDDGVLLVFRAPKSYTGENVAEITCHGGVFVARRVLQSCLKAGAVLAEPGEFTKRAVLNGKMTLSQAEAVLDVINAVGEQYLTFANAQKSGALHRKTEKIAEQILGVSAHIAAWLDYPEEGIDLDCEPQIAVLRDCHEQLKLLLASYDAARGVREGVVTAIVGKPNAGKSTLMNLLTRRERSIVTDIAGTTRDIVEETVELGRTVLRLCDCAGIRDTSDVVEAIGIEYMHRQMSESSLILAVFDNSRELEKDDFMLLERLSGLAGKSVICVVNKSDLPRKLDVSELTARFGSVVEISAKKSDNPDNSDSFERIARVIEDVCEVTAVDLSAGFVANERQRACVIEAEQSVSEAVAGLESGSVPLDAAGFMLENALEAMYRLSGKSASAEIIDEVFRNFCVGK